MYLSKLKYLILSILAFSACNAPRDCISVNNPSEIELAPVISLDSTAPALYSGEFEVMKYRFSGLIAFRKMPENQETRIVFLTEVGIRVMEFTFAKGEIKNTYCLEAAQRKSIIRFIGSFLQMLLSPPEYQSLCLVKTDDKTDYFCKLKKGYATYKFAGKDISYIFLHKNRKNTVEGKYATSSALPDEISVKLKFNTQIQLKRVNNAFK
jgi:hypothetical protein